MFLGHCVKTPEGVERKIFIELILFLNVFYKNVKRKNYNNVENIKENDTYLNMINPLLDSIEEGRRSEAKFQDYDEMKENEQRQKIQELTTPENFWWKFFLIILFGIACLVGIYLYYRFK